MLFRSVSQSRYSKLRVLVGVADIVYFAFKNVVNEVNLNSYLNAFPLGTIKIDNLAGLVPLTEREFVFTSALNGLKFNGTAGQSWVFIEYYKQ